MIGVAGLNRAGVWPVIIVTAGLATAAHFGVFSMPEPAAADVLGPLDAGACADLLRGLAAGVVSEDDAALRRHLHPALLARLAQDRPLAAQVRELLPEPATLRRFERARFELQGVGTDAAGVSEGVRGQRQARLVVHLGDDTRRTMVVRVAPHEARWKFLGPGE